MKVVLLAPANVIHTQRWVDGLAARGVTVVLATQHPEGSWRAPPGVRTEVLPHRGTAGYFRNVPALRRLLRRERPDLLNVHYASGYATTAALAGFRPWLLSVWGSDVYDFPYECVLKGWWLRRNLRAADAIASTSEAMAAQVRKLVPALPSVTVTPFGIDTVRFAPAPQTHSGLVIGTVKKLEPKYGIDVLLRAFADVVADAGDQIPLSLELVGEGGQRAELEQLAISLHIDHLVQFVGAVPHADVPRWLNRFDIYVAASRAESFGVAVLEASACGVPVVVSDAGGLPEVVADGQSGLVVRREDVCALANALRGLIADAGLRRRMGQTGRERVQRLYEWQGCVDQMLACFESVIGQRRSGQNAGRKTRSR
jgi:glycosyltransferase involved in cell wall biosynthesis